MSFRGCRQGIGILTGPEPRYLMLLKQRGRTRHDRRHLCFLRVISVASRTTARGGRRCPPVDASSPPIVKDPSSI